MYCWQNRHYLTYTIFQMSFFCTCLMSLMFQERCGIHTHPHTLASCCVDLCEKSPLSQWLRRPRVGIFGTECCRAPHCQGLYAISDFGSRAPERQRNKSTHGNECTICACHLLFALLFFVFYLVALFLNRCRRAQCRCSLVPPTAAYSRLPLTASLVFSLVSSGPFLWNCPL